MGHRFQKNFKQNSPSGANISWPERTQGKSLFQNIQGEQFMKLRIAISTFAMLGHLLGNHENVLVRCR